MEAIGQTYVNPDLEGEDEIEEEEEAAKLATVFLVDMAPSMLQPRVENFSWADMALLNISHHITHDALQAPENMHAVVFFGAQVQEPKDADEGIHVMLPLSRPSVAGLRKVDPTNFDSDDHLQTAIGSAPTPPHGSRIHFLSAAVTKARQMLEKLIRSKGKTGPRVDMSVYVYTDDDNVMGSGSGALAYANKAKGVTKTLAEMAAQGVQVDVALFYDGPSLPSTDAWDDLLPDVSGVSGSAGGLGQTSQATEGLGTQATQAMGVQGAGHGVDRGAGAMGIKVAVDGQMDGPSMDMPTVTPWSKEQVQAHIQGFECGNIRVARRKRAYRTLPLCIGPDGPPFMVRAYYTVKKTPLPSPVWIDPENRETRPLTKFVVKSTTQVMDREQVTGRQIRYGRGETVTLQASDMARARNPAKDAGVSGIRVVGFIPRDDLTALDEMGAGMFLYPDTSLASVRKKHVRQFLTLHQAMLARGVVAVALMASPAGGLSPIALIPTRESWLGDPGMGLQLVGDGFWEMTTPTANQLRALREMLLKAGYVPDTHEPSPYSVRAAEGLVDRLRLGREEDWHTVQHVFNPVLQRHFQVVRHAAQGTLADYVPDNRQDHTLPDPRMDVACEDVIGQFARACQLGVSGGRGGGEGGRGRGSGGAGVKRKAEGEGEEVGEGEVMRLHAEGRLSTLTVPSLKSFLASKGLHVTGKKADLIERIGNYLAK